jgi:hypothetical protein
LPVIVTMVRRTCLFFVFMFICGLFEMSAWTYRLMVRPPLRLLHLVLESHDGKALVPIPERSTSP